MRGMRILLTRKIKGGKNGLMKDKRGALIYNSVCQSLHQCLPRMVCCCICFLDCPVAALNFRGHWQWLVGTVRGSRTALVLGYLITNRLSCTHVSRVLTLKFSSDNTFRIRWRQCSKERA